MALNSKEMALMIERMMDDKKAQDIIALDVAEMTIIADEFVICSVRSTVQSRALCDYIEEKMDECHIPLRRLEGYREGCWIVMDYGDVIVHIFRQEEREFYSLERLWSEGDNIHVAAKA
ncbi:MAG: ribosome-associated protein [Clostridiales bacterium]|nr:ribosome-associated protein [Clostridiales bacterium]